MNEFDLNTKVITSRLVLQPVSEKFKFEIFNEFTPEITRFMPFTPNGDIKITEDFIANSNRELIAGKAIHLCILKKETNEFLGCCGLHHTDAKAIEIGLWLKKTAHGIGYGIEIVIALIGLAEKNPGLEYVYYPVDKDNIASRRIPEKLGFIPALTYDVKKSESEILNIIEFRKQKSSL